MAARFPDRRRASRALGQLKRRMPNGAGSVAIAPLGIPGEKSNGETVLAGRFPEEQTAELDALVRNEGGEIVADVDERLTRPWHRPTTRSPAGG